MPVGMKMARPNFSFLLATIGLDFEPKITLKVKSVAGPAWVHEEEGTSLSAATGTSHPIGVGRGQRLGLTLAVQQTLKGKKCALHPFKGVLLLHHYAPPHHIRRNPSEFLLGLLLNQCGPWGAESTV